MAWESAIWRSRSSSRASNGLCTHLRRRRIRRRDHPATPRIGCLGSEAPRAETWMAKRFPSRWRLLWSPARGRPAAWPSRSFQATGSVARRVCRSGGTGVWAHDHRRGGGFRVRGRGKLLPIDVTASASPRPADGAHLRSFRADYGNKARAGLLLHTGSSVEWLPPPRCDGGTAALRIAFQPVNGSGVSRRRLPARVFKLVDQQQGFIVASARPRQSLRRWGNSLGVRLPAAISREAGLQDNQTVELRVVAEGVLIRPVEPRLTLAERLAAFAPMEGEATEAMAWDPVGAEAIE